MTVVNPKQLKIAKRYASALLAFDGANGIYSELQNVSATLANSSDLLAFLENPVISVVDKKAVIEEVFAALSNNAKNFLYLLIDKNRFDYFDAIMLEFRLGLDISGGLQRVEVISAIELEIGEKDRLLEVLQNKLSGQIVPEYKVDEAIIAGLVIKIGDKVIDNSLKTRFKGLERQLI